MELGGHGVKFSLMLITMYCCYTDAMKKVLMEAHKGTEKQSEDHLEARIRFLQHQVS